jgi:hypothetical protein
MANGKIPLAARTPPAQPTWRSALQGVEALQSVDLAWRDTT